MNQLQEIMNNLTLEQVKYIVYGTAGATAIIIASFFIILFKSRKNSNTKMFDLIDNQLREQKRGLFNYKRIDNYLKKNGVDYHYPFMGEPLKFLLFFIITVGTGASVGSLIHPYASVLGGIIGIAFPFLLIQTTVKKENEEILEDIKVIYNSLTAQIRAGIYVSAAIAECSSASVITNKRLLKEMQRMSANIQLTSDIEMATDSFAKRFNNPYIDSLGIILCQALESGKATDALGDISKQLKDVEKSLFATMRERKQLRNFGFEAVLFFLSIAYLFATIVPALTSSLSGISA